MGKHVRAALETARKLTRDEQIELVEKILVGLPLEAPEDARKLIDECKRRLAAYDRGEEEAYDADEVFAELRKK